MKTSVLKSRFSLGILLPLIISTAGVTAAPADPPPDDRQVGFYLLRDVCQDEAQINMVTWVKTTPRDTVDYVQRIAKLAKVNCDQIDDWEKARPRLKLDAMPLPPFEIAVRDAISADQEHQLLFGTKGAAYVRALIVTQIDASNYIAHMEKLLAPQMTSARQTRALDELSQRWFKVRDDGFRLLGEQ